ncbi:uncharacterized protein LOC135690062 isoform X2 [Rhopilema esculentum]|uniref:uncharacterized protein LOC135690062 isoform X2 n=1 Tax=Rhopilema esculentum TaxID=499914 RepID=UPI0031D6AB6C
MDTLKVPGTQDIFRIRSKSLENLTHLGAPRNDKHTLGPSLSPPGHLFRGLRKKLGLMMSKSNQDVTASDTPEDSKKLLRAQLSAGFIGMEKRSKDDRSRSS